MRIALCFRGIARSLVHTISSIQSNVISPAQKFGEVRIFTHLFNLKQIGEPGRGEFGAPDPFEYQLLQSDELQLEEPGTCLDQHAYDQIRQFGDAWSNDFRSLKNLIHALHSLKKGWEMARQWQPDVVCFLRPDLNYLNSLETIFKQVADGQRRGLCLPIWHSNWGINDRFAIASTEQAAHSYANRIDRAMTYCQETKKPLHAEIFLLHCLKQDKTPTWFTTAKAQRVRFGGIPRFEKYSVIKGANVYAWYHGMLTGFAKF